MIVPNWNGAHLIGPCLDALRQQRYANVETLVVDGASTDDSVKLVHSRYPEVRLLCLSRNLGFTGNVNAGLRSARGEVLALLNNDAVAAPGWVGALVEALAGQPDLGSCASRILHLQQPGLIASAGDTLGRDGLARQRGNGQPDGGEFSQAGDVFSASGGAAAYRREMLRDVGLLDERFFMYLEDIDLGLRAQLRGWRCRYVPTAVVQHHVSATGGGALASYYVARNSIRVIARGFPTPIVRRCLVRVVSAQIDRASDATRAWRGVEARATLRGLSAGLTDLPDAIRSRGPIQAGRRISDARFLALLEP